MRDKEKKSKQSTSAYRINKALCKQGKGEFLFIQFNPNLRAKSLFQFFFLFFFLFFSFYEFVRLAHFNIAQDEESRGFYFSSFRINSRISIRKCVRPSVPTSVRSSVKGELKPGRDNAFFLTICQTCFTLINQCNLSVSFF